MAGLTDRFRPPIPVSHKTVSVAVHDTVSDLERILALPKRPPVDCERDPRTGRYQPLTQALIELMTERFSRGQRLSCACRERRVTLYENGTVIVARVLPEGAQPEAPIITTMDALIADNNPVIDFEAQIIHMLRAMQPGQTITLPAADGVGRPCIKSLNAPQSWLLFEGQQVEGAVGFLGVGSGKSIALMLASQLFADARLAVLLMEPKQRAHFVSQYVRLREHFRPFSLIPDDRPGFTIPGTIPLHLISYSVLSQTKNTDLLDQKSPDVLLGDEFHRACGNSAINRRVKRYIAGKIAEREAAMARGEKVRRRAVRLLGASGTLESASIQDTHMVCTFALGTGSPLPLDKHEAARWSQVMDTSYKPDTDSKTAKALQRTFGNGEVDTFYDLGGGTAQKAVRDGFKLRRLHTPGIVSASASSINASIYITERKAPPMPPSVRQALMDIRTIGKRPDGMQFEEEERLEQLACARNIACGFYNYWAFPAHPCNPSKCAVARCEQCILIDTWYLRRKAFYKALRIKLIDGEVQLDSEALCIEAAERYHNNAATAVAWTPNTSYALGAALLRNERLLYCTREGVSGTTPPTGSGWDGSVVWKDQGPTWECAPWVEWREIRDRVQYEEREAWIKDGGDYLAKDAAKYATENEAVIWVQSSAMGQLIAELAKIPFYNGGPGAEGRMRLEKGDRSIVCSIKAHGAGTDGLQLIYNEQLIVETPASNSKVTGYEQLLGRLHREGQPKDSVITWVYTHVRELLDALWKALVQADFNFELQGNRQKLKMATLDIPGLKTAAEDDDDY